MKKQGVISLGEAFVDLISLDLTNTKFQPFLGGATVNVAVGTRRYGIPTHYLCKLGTDETSIFVEKELKKEQVNLDFCVESAAKKVCCVYVHINKHGDRYFHSYINETPDEWLTETELSKEPFESGKIFYFGSGTLFHPTSRKTTVFALHYARECGTLVAFDTNIRLKRWESEEICRETICSFIKQADLVKMADDELFFLTEEKTIEEALNKISDWNIPFLFITKGKKGAYAVHDRKKIAVPGIEINAVDTTGAGDAFMAAILYCFHEKGIPADESQLKEYLEIANQAGALATTKIGSL
ncbi:carbohydrate kinase family protein [Neobacillus sp. LXY-4]|uniref:carbohydrate kinase family protein n=1 Tax=Neobacillus sp. LXY-4 TaxID=3379826 RepID=UPI003EE1F4AE